jgi:uncharacterized glyoxalase superfamily protein PhnB
MAAGKGPACRRKSAPNDELDMTTTINPVVQYRDLDAGARFLVDTFGFVQHAAHRADDGSIQYVELSLKGAPLGLGAHTEGSMFDTGPSVVYISLDEVDSMHERALAAGAEILMAPTDQDYGSRDFVAKDHEGNVWCFGTYQPSS